MECRRLPAQMRRRGGSRAFALPGVPALQTARRRPRPMSALRLRLLGRRFALTNKLAWPPSTAPLIRRSGRTSAILRACGKPQCGAVDLIPGCRIANPPPWVRLPPRSFEAKAVLSGDAMRWGLLALVVAALFAGKAAADSSQWYGTGSSKRSHAVRGYSRQDGSQVAPHARAIPTRPSSITTPPRETAIRSRSSPAAAGRTTKPRHTPLAYVDRTAPPHLPRSYGGGCQPIDQACRKAARPGLVTRGEPFYTLTARPMLSDI